MKFTKILTLHLLIGVPAAAFAHSVVQLAYETPTTPAEFGWFPIHFLFGVGCGLPILIPAYVLQAGLFALLWRMKSNGLVQVVAGAALQAALVSLWAMFVGVQPSLAGNFPMTPVMIGAAAVVGGLVAALNSRFLARSRACYTLFDR